MAEALAAVGVAASFIQLTDASLRTCLYLYSFFSSLHKAQDEFQRHIIVLRDVHDAIQLIRQNTATQSLPPAEEAAVRKHLLSITHELSTLEKLTAGKNPAKLSVRLKWVMKSTETDRTLQELERRKTSLILLLQTITLRSSAQSYERQETNQAMLKSLTSLVEQQSQQDVPTNPEISARFDRLSIQMDSNLRMYKESLNESFSTLTRDREVTIPEECMEQTLRRVLDGYILPRVEESFSKTYQLQNAATLRHIQEAMSQATEHILSQIADTTSGGCDLGSQSICSHSDPEQLEWQRNERLKTGTSFQGSPYVLRSEGSQILSPSDETSDHEAKPVGQLRHSRKKDWSYWVSIPVVGTFLIQYGSQFGNCRRLWTIQIHLWPSTTFLLRKCISLKYSNDYDPQGYMALFPSLAVYPTISRDDPIWYLIFTGDLDGVRRRFQDHKNGPHDADPLRCSLLMFAVSIGKLEVARFLLTQGADPTRPMYTGADSLYFMIRYNLYCVILRPGDEDDLRSCRANFSQFSSLFHVLVASGCDPDDYHITIFNFLEKHEFAELSLNQEVVADEIHEPFRDDDDSEESGDCESEGIRHEDTSTHPSNSALQLGSLDEESYLAEIRQLAQFLRCQGVDLLQETKHSRVFQLLGDLKPKRMTLSVLREFGLNSNYRHPGLDCMSSLLYSSLLNLEKYRSVVGMNNLIDLISSGADIYDIEPADERMIDFADEDGLISPTVVAEALDIVPLWRYVLREAGHDPEEVFLEDKRRRREFRRLHGANSSGVEVEHPPSSTLRRRLV